MDAVKNEMMEASVLVCVEEPARLREGMHAYVSGRVRAQDTKRRRKVMVRKKRWHSAKQNHPAICGVDRGELYKMRI